MNLVEFSKRLSQTIAGFDNLINRAVFEHEAEIIDLNTAQLSEGKDKTGEYLRDYRSESYAKFKIARGSKAPFMTPNLYLEGDFYRGFELDREGADFDIFSTDQKNDKLKGMYGEDIFGLSEESKSDLKPGLTETLITEIKDELLR